MCIYPGMKHEYQQNISNLAVYWLFNYVRSVTNLKQMKIDIIFKYLWCVKIRRHKIQIYRTADCEDFN